MKILVVYDISGMDTPEGQARWRKVANACKGHGQRVQKSVFECTLTEVLLENLKHILLDCIDIQQDRLRIYRLPSTEKYATLWAYGVQDEIDFGGPLIL